MLNLRGRPGAVIMEMDEVTMDNDRTEFRCPSCDACRWHGDLVLPGGLIVTCLECGWSSPVQAIEDELRAELEG